VFCSLEKRLERVGTGASVVLVDSAATWRWMAVPRRRLTDSQLDGARRVTFLVRNRAASPERSKAAITDRVCENTRSHGVAGHRLSLTDLPDEYAQPRSADSSTVA
jgi:hypothetical protein